MTGTILQREEKHLLRFLVSGGLCVATDLGVFVLLQHAGWGYMTAKGVSYVAGVLLGFGLNKWWTFGSKRLSLDEPIFYALVYAVTLGVNMALYAAVLRWALGFGLPERASQASAFLAATGVTTVLNYLGLRFIAFRRGIAEAEVAA